MRNYWAVILFFLLFHGIALSQSQLVAAGLTSRLDSMRLSNGVGSHFAELYFKTTLSTDVYIQGLPIEAQQLMKKMENNFADYFFRAAAANQNRGRIAAEWENYFNDNNFSSVQFKLIGANAHINGDIWQVLRSSFSLEEIQKLKPYYKDYNKSLNKIYDELFETAIHADKRLSSLHSVTLGLDKVYGKIVLHKWRKRQLKLAIYSYNDPARFKKLKRRTDNKRKNLDRLIMTRLRPPA